MKIMGRKEAYIYVFQILQEYWNKTRDEELGGILGGLNPWSPLSKDERPGDPAAWQDWLDAVEKVSSNEYITEEEARKAMLVLLKEYNDHHGFDLKKTIQYFSHEVSS